MATRHFPGRAPSGAPGRAASSPSSSSSEGADESGDNRGRTTVEKPEAPAGSSPTPAPTRRKRERKAPVVLQPACDVRPRSPPPPPPPRSLKQQPPPPPPPSLPGRREGPGGRGRNDEDAGNGDDGREELRGSRSGSGSGSSSGSESYSGSESSGQDDEDDGYGDMDALPKPVFIPKASRLTEKIRAEREKAERVEAGRIEARSDARVEETRKQVAEMLSREDMQLLTGGRENEDVLNFPDDTDGGEDAAMQYALWKVREIKRIKRDRDEAAVRASGVGADGGG